jgi:hypothetical protein
MSTVIITLRYSETQMIDLALPEYIPNQFLARSLAKAFAVEVPDGNVPVLTTTEMGETRQLPPAGTLRSACILNGSYLELKVECRAAASAYLQAESGLFFGLEGIRTIGRSTVHKQVDIDLAGLDTELVVSRRHAKISQEGMSFLLEDTKSSHGTWVNGEKIEQSQRAFLLDGDVIVFGPLEKGIQMTFINR